MKKEIKEKIIKCPSGQHIRLDGKPPKCHCEIRLQNSQWADDFIKWYKSYSVCPPWSSIIGWIARHKKKWEKPALKNKGRTN